MFEPQHRVRLVKTCTLCTVLNAKHVIRHASMSVDVLLHFNAAMQHIFDLSYSELGRVPGSGVRWGYLNVSDFP